MSGNSSTNPDISIRAADLADADAISDCVASAYQRYIPLMGKPPGPMLDDYAANIANHHVYVVESDSVLAGILVLIKQADSLLLDNVAVNPAFQGQGIGKRLMAFAENRAEAWGFDCIELYTHEVMEENLVIYKKIGYLESERKTVNGYDRVYMRKNLNAA